MKAHTQEVIEGRGSAAPSAIIECLKNHSISIEKSCCGIFLTETMSCKKSRKFGTHNVSFSVLVALVLFSNSVYSFVCNSMHRVGKSCASRKVELNVFRTTFSDENADTLVSSVDRRALFFTGASAAAGYFLKETFPISNSPAILTSVQSSAESGALESSIASVSSADEALKIIEARGDKRFLHAVVASDYKFLYEQTKTVPSDIDVECIFSKKVPSVGKEPRSVLLATTGNLGAKNSASLWPLENAITKDSDVHYAWPELGGVLQSNQQGTASAGASQKIIVDGIDCGKMSLEDALEGNMQVLVQAPTYLLVPNHMESSLKKGLKGAFLI